MRQLLGLVVEFVVEREVIAFARRPASTAMHAIVRKQSVFFKARSEAFVRDEDLVWLR